MEEMILGLLYQNSHTVYELKELIEKDFKYVFSASFGSIQKTLQKLQDKKEIQFTPKIEGSKYKKIYEITKLGKRHFDGWMKTVQMDFSFKNKDLLPLFFMDFQPEETSKQMLTSSLQRLKERYVILKKQYDEEKENQLKNEHDPSFFMLEYELGLIRCHARLYRKLWKKMNLK